MENWKDIKGYKGLYQVSDMGNVRSLDREIICKDGKIKKLHGKTLMQFNTGGGYRKVSLSNKSVQKDWAVHILVAIHFLNHKPNKYTVVVDHVNHNPLDNRLINLQLLSNRQNSSKDKHRYNTSSKYIGVCWHKRHKKWYSSIRINGKIIHLGCFDNELEAHKAYQSKLKEVENVN